MIKFITNDFAFDWMTASGALGFDGRGWPWEKPFICTGLMQPKLFTNVTKTLTRHPREGNLKWHKPWECVRLIPGGAVNKVGLTNPGIDWWIHAVAPTIDFESAPLVVSIFGDENELVEMAETLNDLSIIAIEVNPSCINTGHPLASAETVVQQVKAVKRVTRHPIIIKVSVTQPYLTIARGLRNVAEAISLNTVPWELVFPDTPSPLSRLQNRVGGGGGGVSGRPAQPFNWLAVEALAQQNILPVIGPDVMSWKDIVYLRKIGAKAISFGAIHLRAPWKPTNLVYKSCARL